MIKQKNIFHQKNVIHVMKLDDLKKVKLDDLKKEISSMSKEIVENEKDYWSKQVELFQENTKYKELLEDYDSLKKVADLVSNKNFHFFFFFLGGGRSFSFLKKNPSKFLQYLGKSIFFSYVDVFQENTKYKELLEDYESLKRYNVFFY